jgi:ABC-type branched-subunit amino acid transport system permease subunit
VLATLGVPITESDSRYEPVVLVGAALVLGVALALLGIRRLLWTGVTVTVTVAVLVTPAAPWAGHLPSVDLAACLAVAGLGAVVLGCWGGRPAAATLVLAVALDATTLFRPGGAGNLPGHDPGGPSARHWMVCALLAASMLTVAALRRSRVGLALVAARDDERAAAVRGVDVAGTRRAAWVIAALLAGAAGCGLVLVHGGAAPGPYDVTTSVTLVVLVSLLGAGRITSALIAGAVCGFAADPSGAAPGIAGGEPGWLGLVVGTTAVVALVLRERLRCGHKRPMRWIGPAVAAALHHVTPSQRRTTGFGAMSGDAE